MKKPFTFTPLIVGSGRAGQAIIKSLKILDVVDSNVFKILPYKQLARGAPISEAIHNLENPILFIANPPGLHTQYIVEAERAGVAGIFTEKPVCVNLEQASQLEKIETKTAVFHTYRQLWGPQTLRQMMVEGAFGKIISIESRFWQPGLATRSLEKINSPPSWKDDPKLNGNFGVLLDLGTHWVDMVSFIVGEPLLNLQGWKSNINGAPPYNDSHIHLILKYPNSIRVLGSLSKTVHGVTNKLEVDIIGSKKSASWNFLSPDEIMVGQARDRWVTTRKDSQSGAKQAAFHGLGWIDGYVEIIRQGLLDLAGSPIKPYPTLKDSVAVTKALLSAQLID